MTGRRRRTLLRRLIRLLLTRRLREKVNVFSMMNMLDNMVLRRCILTMHEKPTGSVNSLLCETTFVNTSFRYSEIITALPSSATFASNTTTTFQFTTGSPLASACSSYVSSSSS